MRAIVIEGVGRIVHTVVPDPTPDQGEVVIEVAASGICGTDLHILHGEYAPTLPIIPGHEFAGTVVALGEDVRNVRVGDRVVADPNVPCRHCRYCQSGRINLCDFYDAVGVTRNGAAADFVAVPAELCVVLPDAVSLEHAALIEPLSCAVHAVDLLATRPGDHVAIYGAGTMGLMMLQLATSGGASSVDVIDLNDLKLGAARELGASDAAQSSSLLERGERGWDVVIDATGSIAAIQDGIAHVAKGGTFLQFGVASPGKTVAIEPHRIYDEEIRIIGSVCPENAFGRSVDLLAAGRIDPEVLISDRVALSEYEAAIAKFAAGETKKVLVKPDRLKLGGASERVASGGTS